MSFLGFLSDAKSKDESGFPSSPTWQWLQRTPSERVNAIIAPRRSSFDVFLGRTLRFFGLSGQSQAGGCCAKAWPASDRTSAAEATGTTRDVGREIRIVSPVRLLGCAASESETVRSQGYARAWRASNGEDPPRDTLPPHEPLHPRPLGPRDPPAHPAAPDLRADHPALLRGRRD